MTKVYFFNYTTADVRKRGNIWCMQYLKKIP